MIVLTSVSTYSRHVMPTDVFSLKIEDEMGCEIIIEEQIIVHKIINFIASYRFALEDGTCPGFHLCGIFGNQDELPKEIVNAHRLEDLSDEQYRNFCSSVGTFIPRRETQRATKPKRIKLKKLIGEYISK